MIRWRDSSSLPLPQANAIDQHQGIKRYEVKKKGELYQLPPLVLSAVQHVSQTELVTVVITSVHARAARCVRPVISGERHRRVKLGVCH